ncbi:MAG TPA: hypothetical protein VK508_21645 [Cyclobacteriaceae bacterium]|nr:hypothetical protein [Cyclobacteriaceae bacterium]
MANRETPSLSEVINELKTLEKEILRVGREQIEAHNGIYAFDLYCSAILNRAINIQAGYIVLIESNNFLSAAPLVRIHLDTLLRLSAPFSCGKNVDEFAGKVFGGKQINELKNSKGEKLRDGFLANELSKRRDFSWVKELYKTGSSFIHFSDKHIFTSVKIDKSKDRTINTVVGVHDGFIPLEEKIGATIYMTKITKGILLFIESWTDRKKTYPKQTKIA